MVHDPRRDSRVQRAQQLVGRGQLYPTREVFPPQPQISVPPDALVLPPDFSRGDRFFEGVEMEDVQDDGEGGGIASPGSGLGTIDPMDWNENHPLWLAYKKGQVRLAEVNGQLHIIDKREDVEESINDLMPRQVFSKGDFVEMDRLASLAQLQYRLGKTMIAYAICDFVTPVPGTTNAVIIANGGSPLLTLPVQANAGVAPVGGAIITAELDIGFEGAGQHVVFDMPPGEIIKLPFSGQFGRLNARLRPKYYTPSDDAGAHVRTYLASPGGPTLTSELWNSLPTSIMAQNAFPNPNSQNVQGWISQGIQSNDLPRSPIRRFFGTVLCNGTVATWQTQCPIAFSASHVILTGGLYDAAAPGLKSVQFLFILPPTTGVAQRFMGPFDVNTIVPIPYNAQGIAVINSPNPVGGALAVTELPFELQYLLAP